MEAMLPCDNCRMFQMKLLFDSQRPKQYTLLFQTWGRKSYNDNTPDKGTFFILAECKMWNVNASKRLRDKADNQFVFITTDRHTHTHTHTHTPILYNSNMSWRLAVSDTINTVHVGLGVADLAKQWRCHNFPSIVLHYISFRGHISDKRRVNGLTVKGEHTASFRTGCQEKDLDQTRI